MEARASSERRDLNPCPPRIQARRRPEPSPNRAATGLAPWEIALCADPEALFPKWHVVPEMSVKLDTGLDTQILIYPNLLILLALPTGFEPVFSP